VIPDIGGAVHFSEFILDHFLAFVDKPGMSDAFQTTAYGRLSLMTLGGLGLNAVLGWWWADPVACGPRTRAIKQGANGITWNVASPVVDAVRARRHAVGTLSRCHRRTSGVSEGAARSSR